MGKTRKQRITKSRPWFRIEPNLESFCIEMQEISGMIYITFPPVGVLSDSKKASVGVVAPALHAAYLEYPSQWGFRVK